MNESSHRRAAETRAVRPATRGYEEAEESLLGLLSLWNGTLAYDGTRSTLGALPHSSFRWPQEMARGPNVSRGRGRLTHREPRLQDALDDSESRGRLVLRDGRFRTPAAQPRSDDARRVRGARPPGSSRGRPRRAAVWSPGFHEPPRRATYVQRRSAHDVAHSSARRSRAGEGASPVCRTGRVRARTGRRGGCPGGLSRRASANRLPDRRGGRDLPCAGSRQGAPLRGSWGHRVLDRQFARAGARGARRPGAEGYAAVSRHGRGEKLPLAAFEDVALGVDEVLPPARRP